MFKKFIKTAGVTAAALTVALVMAFMVASPPDQTAEAKSTGYAYISRVSPFAIVEDSATKGTTTVTVTVRPTQTFDFSVPVIVTNDGVTYDSPVDVTITAGQSTGTTTISAQTDNDADDEMLSVKLGTPSKDISIFNLTRRAHVVDDELGIVSLRVINTKAIEGEDIYVVASLDSRAIADVEVPVNISGGTVGTHYVGSATRTITISKHRREGMVNIKTIKDADYTDQNLTLDLGTLPDKYLPGAVTSQSVTIVDRAARPYFSQLGPGVGSLLVEWKVPAIPGRETTYEGFRVEYRQKGSTAWNNTTGSALNSDGVGSASLTGLTSGATYEVRVRGTHSQHGNGPWSPTEEVVVK